MPEFGHPYRAENIPVERPAAAETSEMKKEEMRKFLLVYNQAVEAFFVGEREGMQLMDLSTKEAAEFNVLLNTYWADGNTLLENYIDHNPKLLAELLIDIHPDARLKVAEYISRNVAEYDLEAAVEIMNQALYESNYEELEIQAIMIDVRETLAQERASGIRKEVRARIWQLIPAQLAEAVALFDSHTGPGGAFSEGYHLYDAEIAKVITEKGLKEYEKGIENFAVYYHILSEDFPGTSALRENILDKVQVKARAEAESANPVPVGAEYGKQMHLHMLRSLELLPDIAVYIDGLKPTVELVHKIADLKNRDEALAQKVQLEKFTEEERTSIASPVLNAYAKLNINKFLDNIRYLPELSTLSPELLQRVLQFSSELAQRVHFHREELMLSPEEQQKIIEECIIRMFSSESPVVREKIKEYYGPNGAYVSPEHPWPELGETFRARMNQAYAETSPSRHHEARELIKNLLPPDQIDTSWEQAYDKILKLQARSRNIDHDPWKKEFDPLVLKASQEGLLDTAEAKDAEILANFVETYGMFNIPTVLKWHVAIAKADTVADIPASIRAEIESNLGISIERLPNKGFIAQEIKKFKLRLQDELLQDKIPTAVTESDLGLELFYSLKGASSWERSHDPRRVVSVWQETIQANPDLARLAEGYEAFTVEVPVLERSASDKTVEEKRALETQRILTNKELVGYVQKVQEAYIEAKNIGNLDEWWLAKKSKILEEIELEISAIESKRISGTEEKFQIGIEVKLRKLRELQEEVEAITASNTLPAANQPVSREAKSHMLTEILSAQLPKDLKDRGHIIRTVSAYDSLRSMSPGRLQVLDRALAQTGDTLDSTTVALWSDHIQNDMTEHYMHQEQDPRHTGHDAYSSAVLKELKIAWGLQVPDKNILLQKNQQLETIDSQGLRAGTKQIAVDMVPVRGLLRVYAGDLGDACYTNKHGRLARGDYRNLVAYVMVTDKGTPKERLRGSVLVIETEDGDGEPVMLVRANNPQEGLLWQVDSEVLLERMLDKFKALATVRKMKRLTVPLDGSSQSSSNRQKVSSFYSARYGKHPKVRLKREPETTFNNYNNWNPEGAHAVVDILSEQSAKVEV